MVSFFAVGVCRVAEPVADLVSRLAVLKWRAGMFFACRGVEEIYQIEWVVLSRSVRGCARACGSKEIIFPLFTQHLALSARCAPRPRTGLTCPWFCSCKGNWFDIMNTKRKC
jgi:hypothetical protein